MIVRANADFGESRGACETSEPIALRLSQRIHFYWAKAPMLAFAPSKGASHAKLRQT